MKPTQSIAPGAGPVRADSIGMNRWKLILSGVIFFLLTVGIFWYQFHQIQAGTATPSWNRLRWGYLLLILLCLPIETACAAARIWLLCRVLHPGVRLWTCVKAELSNVTISLLTPSQTGGGPAQMYMLSRAGVGVGTSLTISLISFLGTAVILVLMGLYTVFVSGIADLTPLFATVFRVITGIMLAMAVGVVCPGLIRVVLGKLSRARWRLRGGHESLQEWRPPRGDPAAPAEPMGPVGCKLADLVYIYRDDVKKFLRAGKVSFLWACLLSSAFLFSRVLMPYLCLRFLGIEGSTLREIIEVQTALTFLIFFAPTPGGAGLTEGASMTLMSAIVPVGFAPYYNLLWRFSTAYVAALAGLVCLLHAVTRDLGKTVRHFRKPEPQRNHLEIPQPADRTQQRMEVTP
ncbi:MAG TPA: lysylphosphatidylglycerol synthase transmembrane domain-containing protein [Candidatus Binatia bacterium]